MNLSQLKNQLQRSIPEELYKIAPGEIAVLTPKDGLSEQTASNLSSVFHVFSHYGFADQIRLQVLPTDKPELLGAIVGRKDSETGPLYNIIISDDQSLIGFLAAYFSLDFDEFAARSKASPILKLHQKTEFQPLIIPINPKDCPATGHQDGSAHFTCPFMDEGDGNFDMGLRIAKPDPGSRAEKTLKTRMGKKMEKVLRECAIFDIELDVDRIKKKVADSLKSTIEYKLSLDINTIKEGSLSFCTVCDIYVADGEAYKLNLTAAEKAIYLTFMLYENGIRVAETFDKFRGITQKIYNQLPDDDKCEKSAGGILDTGNVIPEVYTSTLRGYISTIRDEVADKIAHPLVAQDFAIEGFKDSEFGVAKSSPELRAQIKEAFAL